MNIEEAKRIVLADLKHEARCIEHRNAEPRRKEVFEWMNSLTPEETVEWELFHAKIRIVCALNMETTVAAELEAALDEALAESAPVPAPPPDSMRWTRRTSIGVHRQNSEEGYGWEGLIAWLKENTHVGEKRDAAVFSPFAGDEAQCIVLDHDHVPGWAFEQHLSDLRARAVDAVVYTTHSHGDRSSRPSGNAYTPASDEATCYFRTVVRLSRPVVSEEYLTLCHYFASHLTARADLSCLHKKQVFFAPSYPLGRTNKHVFHVLSGQPYDVDAHFSND